MTEYNQYVTSVNKIFEIITKLKAGWDDIDNVNAIETIEESKDVVVSVSTIFSNKDMVSNEVYTAGKNLEELGD